jgi:hypothetical protein
MNDPPWMLISMIYDHRFNQLKKTDAGFELTVPIYPASSRQSFCWLTRDVPAAALALLKNYTDPSKGINGKAYPVVTGNMTYVELAEKTAKGAAGIPLTSSLRAD